MKFAALQNVCASVQTAYRDVPKPTAIVMQWLLTASSWTTAITTQHDATAETGETLKRILVTLLHKKGLKACTQQAGKNHIEDKNSPVNEQTQTIILRTVDQWWDYENQAWLALAGIGLISRACTGTGPSAEWFNQTFEAVVGPHFIDRLFKNRSPATNKV